MEKFEAKIITDDNEVKGNILFKEDYLIMNSLEEETILKIFYVDVEEMEYNSNLLEVKDTDDIRYVISCKEEVYNKLKSMTNNLKSPSKKKSTQTNSVKQIRTFNPVWIYVIIGAIIFFVFLIDSSGPASTIADDIRQADAYYGYGTKYEIGQVEKVRCSEQEKDGQGRFIIQCTITYYPKRVNGTISMDSKSSETIYAVYLKLDGKKFLRYYTTYADSSFKSKVCWGRPESVGIQCGILK